MKSLLRLAAILFLFFIYRVVLACDINDVAVYKVKLKTFWDQETFRKDYPFSAGWSQVFGQSHNRTYTLYHIGDVARQLVREFARSGLPELLIDEGNEEPKVYDQFLTPNVTGGVGETENVVFVDSDHSLISLMSRMVPSPDWFVGVDSLDLCVDSTWIDQVTLDLDLLDAGAAEGTTYNQHVVWPSDPVETVERVTMRYSENPLTYLHTRNLRHVPAIAKIEITKIQEYSTKELNDMARKELFTNLKAKKTHDVSQQMEPHEEHLHEWNFNKDELTTKNPFDKLKDLEEDPVGTPRPNNPENYVVVVTKGPQIFDEDDSKEELNNMDDVVLAVATGHKLGLGRHLPRHFRSRLHHAVNRDHHHDCIVSEWSEWSDCTDLCSPSGEMLRTRKVLQQKKKGGRECPDLVEKKACSHKCRGDDYGW